MKMKMTQLIVLVMWILSITAGDKPYDTLHSIDDLDGVSTDSILVRFNDVTMYIKKLNEWITLYDECLSSNNTRDSLDIELKKTEGIIEYHKAVGADISEELLAKPKELRNIILWKYPYKRSLGIFVRYINYGVFCHDRLLLTPKHKILIQSSLELFNTEREMLLTVLKNRLQQ
jgi:hypothetical protein